MLSMKTRRAFYEVEFDRNTIKIATEINLCVAIQPLLKSMKMNPSEASLAPGIHLVAIKTTAIKTTFVWRRFQTTKNVACTLCTAKIANLFVLSVATTTAPCQMAESSSRALKSRMY
eukprot:IDg19297t1